MSSNPDEAYRLKAATDPVAPATLWLYPGLKFMEGAQQRPALENAKRKARTHWLSYALRWCVLAVVAISIWAITTGRGDLRRDLNLAILLLMLAWLLHDFLRARLELRWARSLNAEPELTANKSPERTREG
jgi:hypothetical protein